MGNRWVSTESYEVRPLYKNDGTDKDKRNRPISILPCVLEIYEYIHHYMITLIKNLFQNTNVAFAKASIFSMPSLSRQKTRKFQVTTKNLLRLIICNNAELWKCQFKHKFKNVYTLFTTNIDISLMYIWKFRLCPSFLGNNLKCKPRRYHDCSYWQ